MLEVRLALSRGPQFQLDVAFEVPAGETLVLVGESGSGKSSVLRLLAGLERPHAGRIALEGEVWFDLGTGVDRPPGDRRVGWVPQDYGLFPHLDVFENVAFGLRARRAPDISTRVTDTLRRLAMTEYSTRRPAQLSGGQQQRVALARALVTEPRALLLDEPLAALDLTTRQAIRGELRQLLAGLPCTTVLVTHSPIDALVLGDRIAVLEQGRLTQVGSREDLLRRPRSAYVAQFMGLNLFTGRVVQSGAGVMRVGTGDGEIVVAGSAEAPTEPVYVAVSPREITLYRAAPSGSAQNLFQGKVVELVPEPPFGERVRVVLDTHPRIVAEITAASVMQLGLSEGASVYASFKATGAVPYQ